MPWETSVKTTTDGIDANGKPAHSEWTGKFDGKDYAVTGDPNSDMRSYTKVDDRTLDFVVKKAGKTTAKGRVVISADGKSRTVSVSGTDAKGKKFQNTAVYAQALDEEFVQCCSVRCPQRSGDDLPNRCNRSTRTYCLPVGPHHRARHPAGGNISSISLSTCPV